MAVVDTDIIVYGSANMQETDTGIQGGAIDTTTLVVFNDLTQNTTITVVSDNAVDNQTLTVTGRATDGSIVTDTITLSGTTPVAGTVIFERILKIVWSAASSGSITITESTGGAQIVVAPAGITTVRRIFYNVAADVAGGAARVYYEKIFFYNSNTISALTNATIEEVAGGLANNIAFALENILNGTDSTADRTTAPTGYIFDSTVKNVANSQNHSPTSGQGVWLELSLPAGSAAAKGTYQLRESGQTV